MTYPPLTNTRSLHSIVFNVSSVSNDAILIQPSLLFLGQMLHRHPSADGLRVGRHRTLINTKLGLRAGQVNDNLSHIHGSDADRFLFQCGRKEGIHPERKS